MQTERQSIRCLTARVALVPGGIAQLVEHLTGSQGVRGSNPLTSTKVVRLLLRPLMDALLQPIFTVRGMPRLSEFYGIAIYMYWQDHAPPHFHAFYASDEAQLRISDGSVMRGSLPRTALGLVEEWARLHRDELMDNWESAQSASSLRPIAPLQ